MPKLFFKNIEINELVYFGDQKYDLDVLQIISAAVVVKVFLESESIHCYINYFD